MANCSQDEKKLDIYDTPSDDANYAEIVKKYIENLTGDNIPRQQDWIEPDETEYNCCLFMIVKNEGKIITRCLDSVKEVVDCVAICDTGSTDNCVEVMEEWGRDNNIPIRIYVASYDGTYRDTSWRSFGFNRTQSAIFAHCSFPKAKYLLTIDADMIFKVDSMPDFAKLQAKSYRLIQKNQSISYPNLRLLRNDLEWANVCYTHEYWECLNEGDVGSEENLDELWIDDRGDGGCKSDKYHRDAFLLHMQLDDYPPDDRKHVRALFYAAETHRHIGDRNMAICLYYKRYKAGFYEEERWYSLYMMGKCFLDNYTYGSYPYHPPDDWMRRWRFMAKYRGYEHYPADWQAESENTFRPFTDIVDEELYEGYAKLNPQNAALRFLLKAYNMRPWRAEPLNALAEYYRKKPNKQAVAKLFSQAMLRCNPRNDGLFVGNSEHGYKPWLEIFITAFYTHEYNDGINAGNKVLEMSKTDHVPDHDLEIVTTHMIHYWNKCLEIAEERNNNRLHQQAYNNAMWALECIKDERITVPDEYRAWFIINICCYYIAKYKEGYQAGEKVKQLGASAEIIAQVESNKAFYRKHVATGAIKNARNKGKGKTNSKRKQRRKRR